MINSARLSKEFFYQPIVILSLLAFLLWSIVDFSSRIFKNEVSTSSNINNIDSIEHNELHLDEQQIEQIQILYKRYEPIVEPVKIKNVAKVKKVPVGMTREQQLMQQGLLKTVYIDDNKLELKAVINDLEMKTEPLTALILVSNVKTKHNKIERFINKSLVYGYTLTIDKNTRVTLSRSVLEEGKEYSQYITLTMYQTSK